MHVFLCSNNPSSNKWLNFKIPSWSVCTIIPFSTCSLTRYVKPIMFKFYHVLAQRQMLGLNLTNFSKLSTSFLCLFHNILNMTWITLSFNCKYHLMQPYWYPLHSLCTFSQLTMCLSIKLYFMKEVQLYSNEYETTLTLYTFGIMSDAPQHLHFEI